MAAAARENIEVLDSGQVDPMIPKSAPKKRWGEVKKHFLKNPSTDTDAGQETVQKWQSLVKSAKSGVSDFMGLDYQTTDKKNVDKWKGRSKQLYANSILFGKQRQSPSHQTDGGGRAGPEMEMQSLSVGEGRDEVDIFLSPSRRAQRNVRTHRHTKDSVVKMAWKAMRKYDHVVPEGTDAQKIRSFAPNLQEGTDAQKIQSFAPNLQSWGSHHIVEEKFFDEHVSTSYKKTPVSDDQVEGGKDVVVFAPNFDRHARQLKNGYTVPKTDDIGAKRIMTNVLEELQNNTKREVGVGFFGRYLFQSEQDNNLTEDIKKQLDELGDVNHRPYFTYWVTFVQVVCYIIAVSVYGIAPWGIQETTVDGEVLTSGLFVGVVHYLEKDNLWVGPKQADLIHLGAKYSPCMRKDTNVEEAILRDRRKENSTACCSRNDGSGCVQLPAAMCSTILSTWLDSSHYSSDQNRTSGTVCGQDPQYCVAPASHAPYIWPDEIVKWPICTVKGKIDSGAPEHMSCDIAGRPCCIGIQGECMITTREHCTFMRGYFHEEATLCAQISCMSETCGMLPFYNPDRPDQFYRLWTSLFIHAGLFQLLISVLFQVFIMRDVEKFIGWFRVCVIYIMSGIAGSLASAIFVPYHVEAGPSGSQFGILACLFVEFIQNWQAVPFIQLAKFMCFLLVLFVIGLLPMIDNYAHLFGFVFGFLLSFTLMPHVDFNITDKKIKNICIFVCLCSSLGMFALLIILFYVTPIYSCEYCQYFSCIPFTTTFCRSMEVKIRRVDEF